MAEERRDNELVLPIGTHAFVLDTNQARLQTCAGPQKITIAGTERTVIFDPSSPSRFKEVQPSLAIQVNKVVPKGSYAILKHPHKDLSFPREGKPDELMPGALEVGKVVNLPGPRSFALWPGQEVEIVPGHQLGTNEYLIVRIYDEEEARKNWGKGTVQLAESTKPDQLERPPEQGEVAKSTFLEIDPKTIVIGQLALIKGKDVSFFIPPTGVEVVKDANGTFVRQALTLERLEYCLLVDQDGNKRYVPGPDVVFPKPTETFRLNDDGEKKSRAYELNPISGLHVKVIADYTDAVSDDANLSALAKAGFHLSPDYKTMSNVCGEELFITGEAMAIYFPRIEHAILTYGSGKESKRSRYHAVAIPPGEARYVMNRLTGEIRTVKGEAMLLPDPRTEVIAKRVLSPTECRRYYPGNEEVLNYNAALRQQNADPELAAMMNLSNVAGTSRLRTGHVQADTMVSYASSSLSRAADVIDRSTQFTPPRSLILDPKFEGAPKINPWTGYAIKLVNAKGEGEVVVGPTTVHLEFDQRLEPLFFSTGTPKQHDKLSEQAYLKVDNNVTDDFVVTTNDLVPIKLRVKYLVHFAEEARDRWFSVDNYVQLLVDHFRSAVSNLARKQKAPSFYLEAGEILQDWILGEQVGGERPGYTFDENGMVVYGMEVISVQVMDAEIAKAMKAAQTEALSAEFEMARINTQLELTIAKEASTRNIANEKFSTTEHFGAIARDTARIESDRLQLEQELRFNRQTFEKAEELKIAEVRSTIAAIETKIELEEWQTQKQKDAAELADYVERTMKEAAAMEQRSRAIQPDLVAALAALAQTGQFEAAARHLGSLAILHDMSLGGVVEQVFKGTPLEGTFKTLSTLGTGKLLQK